MKCEMCGKSIDHLSIDCFTYEGSDRPVDYYINECENNAVYIDTTNNWVGYELSGEEQAETISCPHCGKFPFEGKKYRYMISCGSLCSGVIIHIPKSFFAENANTIRITTADTRTKTVNGTKTKHPTRMITVPAERG